MSVLSWLLNFCISIHDVLKQNCQTLPLTLKSNFVRFPIFTLLLF